MPQLSSYFIGFLTTCLFTGEVFELIQVSNLILKYFVLKLTKDKAEKLYKKHVNIIILIHFRNILLNLVGDQIMLGLVYY